MLRMLFGEPPGASSGRLREAMEPMSAFVALLEAKEKKQPSARLGKIEIWTLGLMGALDELEQSLYASRRFAEQVSVTLVEELGDEQLLNYNRHVYFDKNTFIRIFAVLDKLGTFMNEWYGLQTERIKPHFSYFTVLRNMRNRRLFPELTGPLDEVKTRTREAMDRLRKRRNMEIHYMNPEMHDDLQQVVAGARSGQVRLENLQAQLADADEGFEMVAQSLRLVFKHAAGRVSRG